MEKVKPTILSVLNDPSIYGGPKTYERIKTKNKYPEKFNQYIREHKVIPFQVFYSPGQDLYVYHLQITSLSNSEVVYDVVLKFFTDDATIASQDSLDNYDLEIFSNSPGFSFSFAYVYHQRNILVKELTNKFSESFLSTPPEKSNPTKAVGYDYTVYFALYYLSLNHYYITKKQIALTGKDIRKFNTNDIRDAEEVLNQRNPKELINFKKLERTVKKTLINKPKELVSDLKKRTVGLVKAVKAVGTTKATKAKKPVRAKSAIKPSKAKK